MSGENKYKGFYEARNIIKDLTQKDLVGPVLDDEVLVEWPAQYYAMGKLYPLSEEQEIIDMSRSTAIESDLETYDASLASTNMRNPSSMGITCTLKKDVSRINVKLDFGTYRSLDKKGIEDEKIDVERWKEDIKDDTVFWVREGHSFTVELKLDSLQEIEVIPNVILRGYVHKECRDGEKIVTIVLINNQKAGNDRVESNSKMIFQPHISIYGSRHK
jgi:hypothetical protein